MVINSRVLVFSVLLLTLIQSGFCQQYVGDFCTVRSNGVSGKCELLENCPVAITALQSQGIFPQTCGFQGTLVIVCCPGGGANPKPTPIPTPTPRPTPASVRPTPPVTVRQTPQPTVTDPPITGPLRVGDKSRQKCKEYGEYVKVKDTAPVLIPGSQQYFRTDCAVAEVPLIVGGENAKPKEFPHMALVGFDGEGNEKKWQCGGSLISDRFVMTAGHCLIDKEYGDAKYVRLGDLILNTNSDDAKPQEFNILEKIKHPNYLPPSQYNDIALLKLDGRVNLNPYVRPACLNIERNLNTAKAIATGWGKLGYSSDTSERLLKVTLEYFTHSECNTTYRNNIGIRLRNGIIDETQLCAGSHSEAKDTCQGDSGGPLQIYNGKEVYCTYKVVGVTSFGKTCGAINIAGVYTRVSNYIEWIENIVWP